MKKFLFSLLIIMITFIISACNNDNENSNAYNFCIENNGTIITSKSGETECQYPVIFGYDDGNQVYTAVCEIETFYKNPSSCDDLQDEGLDTTPPLMLLPHDSTAPIKLREAFHIQIKHILEHLDHTGYTHRNHGPFVLYPDSSKLINKDNNLTVLNLDIETFNLFLDCSGFVGYYIVQGIASHLYHEVNTCYHSSRPLAADFADTFEAAEYNTTNDNVRDALLSDLDINASSVIWGRVPHIKDALPGDIIVYKHPENITYNGECNNTVLKGKNTGHVLFIMEKPQLSTKYKNEWLVRVADSTTAPHSADSRYSNAIGGTVKSGSIIYNKSLYDSNNYTAWTLRFKKGDIDSRSTISGGVTKIHLEDDWVEKCFSEDEQIFHRRCDNYGETLEFKIRPQTSHRNSSTGIGIGYIYISNDMSYYRVKRGIDKKQASIFIGRPIVITPNE
jgi:hypothetical protein